MNPDLECSAIQNSQYVQLYSKLEFPFSSHVKKAEYSHVMSGKGK